MGRPAPLRRSPTARLQSTARHDTRTALATVAVNISSGVGFLRGEAYDDSKGLPLDHVTVSLLSDGGGTLATPVNVVADERGQFSIAGRAGEAIVRIAKAGFTSVERRATIPAGSSATLFDARSDPLDPTSNLVSSAVGGQARNHSGRATLQIPPGGLSTDQSMSLTLLSAQGLGALLPAGWSPVAAVDIEPASIAFGFPLALTLPNTASLPSNITLAVARFDASSHEWTSAGTATIDAGGLTLRTTIERSGQFALLVPDAAPFTPAEPTPGAPLTGIDRPANQTTGVTAVGEVVPRSAPPGDDARALGRVGLTTPAPAPSGTFLQARVSERFDLLDQTQVVTQPFTQDLVSYATPRPAVGGALGATFPITPSRNFTIQELMLGVVRLDVTPFAGGDAASVVGPGGGTVTSTDGDTLLVPTGALPDTVPITLRRLTAADAGVTVPAGFELLAALQVDLVGVTLSAPAQLSTAAAGGLTAQDQILVARAFTDPFGQRRLELVAIGELSGGRLVTRTTLGSLSLAGVRSGGEFVYLRAQQAIGFVTGTVTRSGGAALSGVLVTSDSVGVADVTGADGRYLVAARTGLDTTLRAVDPASRDSVSAIVRLDTVGQTLTANLALSVVGPTVIAVSPAAGAIGVALDTSVTVDFSEALDPASISDTTVVLQRAGTAVAADRTLSADARRVVLRPSSPLPGLSTYTLQLTAGLHDLSGNPLTGYTPFRSRRSIRRDRRGLRPGDRRRTAGRERLRAHHRRAGRGRRWSGRDRHQPAHAGNGHRPRAGRRLIPVTGFGSRGRRADADASRGGRTRHDDRHHAVRRFRRLDHRRRRRRHDSRSRRSNGHHLAARARCSRNLPPRGQRHHRTSTPAWWIRLRRFLCALNHRCDVQGACLADPDREPEPHRTGVVSDAALCSGRRAHDAS